VIIDAKHFSSVQRAREREKRVCIVHWQFRNEEQHTTHIKCSTPREGTKTPKKKKEKLIKNQVRKAVLLTERREIM
jgi:hypothetical protein